MRTSRLSKDTSKAVQALSTPRRQTRSSLRASTLRNFTYTTESTASVVKNEVVSDFDHDDGDDSSSLSSAKTEDIEDLLERPIKRRKRNAATPPARIKRETTTTTTKREATRTIKTEIKPKTSTPTTQRRKPVRKIKREDGTIEVQPPSNWETMYEIVKKMRAANPTAPVDTMGCAELHWKASPPKDQRFQTLIALMLSSQTKDTVTAVAMHRLHTELGEQAVKQEAPETKLSADALTKREDVQGATKPSRPPIPLIKKEESEEDEIIRTTSSLNSLVKKEEIDESANNASSLLSSVKKEEVDENEDEAQTNRSSTLTLKNILAVSPERLNELIRTVGFHNNKTKYIKQVAIILRDQYDSDIPSTAEDLMKLPGVGPKMSYLCMSAAWGKHEGIGVDVHVHRITNMWGWHTTKNPEETRIALQSWLPKDKWHEINKLLVGLGQTACLPVARRCGECDLAGTGLCKSEIKGWVAKTKKEKEKKEEKEDEAKVKIEAV